MSVWSGVGDTTVTCGKEQPCVCVCECIPSAADGHCTTVVVQNCREIIPEISAVSALLWAKSRFTELDIYIYIYKKPRLNNSYVYKIDSLLVTRHPLSSMC